MTNFSDAHLSPERPLDPPEKRERCDCGEPFFSAGLHELLFSDRDPFPEECSRCRVMRCWGEYEALYAKTLKEEGEDAAEALTLPWEKDDEA